MNEENNKWLVVVNPKACIGRGEKDWPTIKQILLDEGFDFEAVVTEHQGHAIEIVRQGIAEKASAKSFPLAATAPTTKSSMAFSRKMWFQPPKSRWAQFPSGQATTG